MVLHDRVAPAVPPDENGGAELVKRIRKLRWIGMDEEADQLQLRLKSCGIAPGESVVASPRDTD